MAAQDSGHFDREVTPYTNEDGTVVSRDDGPRRESTLEKLAELEPAFIEGGKVTAGNSCPLNDGAAAVVVMSDSRASELGIKPKARIVASAVSGVDPEIMGVGPIQAVKRVLDQAGMTIDDIDVMELNEAFAAQVIPVCREVGIDPFDDRFNPNGGAIALGHPYGMTGARIMCTLLNDLDAVDGTVGLETMCVGGGQGMAMIVERALIDLHVEEHGEGFPLLLIQGSAGRSGGRGRSGPTTPSVAGCWPSTTAAPACPRSRRARTRWS